MPTPADHEREARRLLAKARCLADALDPTGGLKAILARAQDHLTHALETGPTDPIPTGAGAADLDRELAQLIADQRRDEADPP